MTDNPDTTIDVTPTPAQPALPAPEKQFLDWGELSQAKTELLYFDKYGKYIEYKTMIPMDEFAKIEAKLSQIKSAAQKIQQRTVEILKAVMVNPPVTDASANAVLKSDAGIVFEIIGKVMGNNDKDKDDTAGE